MEEWYQQHVKEVDWHFNYACGLLKLKKVTWRPMDNRTAPVNTAKDYSLGYTDLSKREVTLDILTPRKRKAKAMNGLLRVIAHELAHLQKPPYRQRYRGRLITRIHYPAFYKQCNKNIAKFKKDKELRKYFRV